MDAVRETAREVGVVQACIALGLPRATWYRRQKAPAPPRPRRSARALSPAQRDAVREVLHHPRFADKAPAEIYATLLDEGRYVGSIATMYRILREDDELRERRHARRHPAYARPELLATGPNQLWSWDITRLPGPRKGTYFQLYLILDVYSRYAVGWMVADAERADLAEELIATTCARQRIPRDQLTLHADRGSSMTSRSVAELLADLGVTKTHSRPHVSDDNPYSEASFKTLKYRPTFPARFGSLEDARAHIAVFIQWYNHEHRHSGIGLLTPADLHHGRAQAVLDARQAVLDAAHAAHPERFVHGPPAAGSVPEAVWINPPIPAPP